MAIQLILIKVHLADDKNIDGQSEGPDSYMKKPGEETARLPIE